MKAGANLTNLRELVRGPSALTLGTSLAAQVFLLISGVLAARALGAENRGHLALFWLGPMTFALIGGLGIPQATTYFVAKDLRNARAVVHIAVKISIVLAVVSMLAYGLILLASIDPNDSELRASGLLSVLLIPAFMSQTVGLGCLQGQQRFRAFNAARLIAPSLYAFGVLVLYLGETNSLVAIMVVIVLSWVLAATVTWCVLFRALPTSDVRPEATWRSMIKFGTRGVLGSVSPVDDLRIDQLMVGLVVEPRALGLYVAASSFCNLPRFIAQSIGLVSYPRIASAPSASAAWAVLTRSAKIGLLLVTSTVVALILVVPLALPALYGDEFKDAVKLAYILLAATMFLSFRRLFTEFARGLGHPGFGSIGEVVSTILLVGGVIALTTVTESSIAWLVLVASAVSALLIAVLLLRVRSPSRRDDGA